MESSDVMMDLETLGKGKDAVILSIGATKFDPWGHKIDDSFYVAVDPESCQLAGLTLDASTIMWWMADERTEARSKMTREERVSLIEALYGFSDWFGEKSLPTWGNGSTFDNIIMQSAYKACGLKAPWEFWDDRCYRTVKNLAPTVKLERQGTFHNALDDAVSQTRHLQKLYFALRIPKPAA